MLTVWGRKTSVNVQKAMWLVGELELEHERMDVGGQFGGLDTPEYIKMNPHQLVPTLQDGDMTVWESEAVLRYLGSRYGEQFFPTDIAARTRIDMWMSWVQSTWAPTVTGVFATLVRVPRQDRDQADFEAKLNKLHATAALANGWLEKDPFIAGDSLSLADMAFGAFLYRYYTMEISINDLPALRRYYDALCERPAYIKHVHVDYDVLRVPGAERP